MATKGFEVKLTANVDSYTSAMAKAEASTKSMSSSSNANLSKLGGQMQKVGGQLSRDVTLPVVAAGVAAIAMSSKFETAFARMQGLAGVTADEVDGLKASVLDLAGRTAQAPQDLADALYQASSSGLDTADAMAAVEVAAKGAAAGMGSAADIVGLVASAVASYGSANITAARATDILTAAIREGRADPEELAGTLGRVLPIANAVGISFAEVGGATAYLSNIMGDTNRTVTSLQGLLVKLASPTVQGRQALIDMGTSAAELQDSIDKDGLLGALDLLKRHGFEDNSQAMTQLFDDIEGRQGALALMADESGTLASTMDKVADSAGSLDSAFKIVTDTSGFKMKQSWAEIQVALIKAGDVVMPIISQIAGATANLMSIFADLPKPVQIFVIALLGLAATIGPLLVVGGTLVKNFKEIRTSMTAMTTGATLASTALGAVGLVVIAATAIYSDNAAKKAHLLDVTNQFIDALNREAEGQKGAVGETVATMLANDKLIKQAAQLGLSVGDLSDIVMGKSVPAYDLLKKQADNMTGPFARNREDWNSNTVAIGQLNTALGPMTKGLQDAQRQIETSAAVEKELSARTTETDRETRRLTSAVQDHTGAVHAAALSEEDQAKALQDATDAVRAQVKALQDDLTAQQALVDFARRAADAQYALAASTDDYDRFLEDLPGKLKEINKSKDSEAEKLRQTNELYRDGATIAAKLGDDVVTAYDDAANGALSAKAKGDLWRDSMLTSAAAASGPVRQSILDYVLAVNKVPAEKQTAIVAAIEAGDLATATALLDGASETRKVEVQADVDDKSLSAAQGDLNALQDPLHAQLVVDADTSGAMAKITLMLGRVGVVNSHADGGFIGSPMISTLGEGGRPEVVLPLSKPQRIAELMRDSRVSGPILGAVGGRIAASADGRVVNLTHMSVPAAASDSAATVDGASAQDAQDKVMQREFQRDAISYEQYRAYLMKRKEGLALYSDEEEDLYDRIQQLDETQSKRRDDDAQAQTDQADRIEKYLADTNQISLADYMKYLEDRKGSYEAYTSEWFALSSQIIDIQHQMDTAAADATKAVFDQADAVKSLADAQQANQDAATEFYAAGAKATTTGADKNATADDKQAALDEYNRSAVALAQTAYNLADALANNQGFEDGSVEWARFMRTRLTADSVWNHANGRDNVANAVDRLLLGIPSFASGGYVPATPGGRIIRVAEAGQGEWMFPANRMHAMAMSGGGSVYAPVYHISITGAIDRPGVARELREILGERDRRNGLN